MKKVFKKIISILAYTWAVACILIVFTIFIGSETLTRLSMKLPFMKLDPVYSGGAIVNSYPSDSLLIEVHEPVFSALFGESREGFIQIAFKPGKALSVTSTGAQCDSSNCASSDDALKDNAAAQTASSQSASNDNAPTDNAVATVQSAPNASSENGIAENASTDNASASSENDTAVLPRNICETIDYDCDGTADFIVSVDTSTGETALKVCPSKKMYINTSSKAKDYWVVRVGLPNPKYTTPCASCSDCPAKK